jgi:hypothetical protein
VSGNYIAWDVGMSAYTTRDADGFYRVQIAGFAKAGSQPFEAYHPVGFLGRQRDPEVDPSGAPKLGPTTLYGLEGNQGHAILLNDPRAAGRLPEVKLGGSMQYADTGGDVAYALFDGDTGAWTLKVGGTTVKVEASGTEIGGAGAKALINQDLLTWITSELIPKLATAPGGSITVTPPSNITTTTTRAA